MPILCASESEIRKLFKNHCVLCGKPAHHVHEIIPKSKIRDWKHWENRALLCVGCHTRVHSEGALNWAERLVERCVEKLMAYYGRNYKSQIEKRLL